MQLWPLNLLLTKDLLLAAQYSDKGFFSNNMYAVRILYFKRKLGQIRPFSLYFGPNQILNFCFLKQNQNNSNETNGNLPKPTKTNNSTGFSPKDKY